MTDESQAGAPEKPAAESVASMAPPEPTPPTEPPTEPLAAESAAPPTTASEADTESGESKPSDRLKVGTQREAGEASAPQPELKPKPVNPVSEGAEPAPAPAGPPPNPRAAATPEEEAELQQLMDGASVEQVLDSTEAAAPAEIEPGTRKQGKVVRVSGDSVFVELGVHLQGVVPLKQFEPKGSKDAPAAVATVPAPTPVEPVSETPVEAPAEPSDAPAEPTVETPAASSSSTDAGLPGAAHAPAEGTTIEVIVAGLNADEGIYDLTLPTAPQEIGNWDEVEVGKVVEVTITGSNKGGLECKVSGIRGFMPMGQISIYRVENAEEYVGQRLSAVITEANRGRKNVILSHRAVMERERSEKRDQLLAELAPGQLRDGVVRSLRDFGAFVDLGGVDGMVHVSKLSWDRVSHPRDVLTEGQQITVKIEKVDQETGKIALSYREAAANPWDTAEADFPVGSTARGKVSKLMDFGAFVRLKAGVEGLIHISELDHKRVNRTGDVVSEGQEVEAKVLSVDRGKQRIALSLKALSAAPVAEKKRHDEPEDDTPRPERKQFKNLKGGIGGPSGGEKFGLKW